MLKFLKNGVLKKQQNNCDAEQKRTSAALNRLRSRIFWQAGLAVLTVVLTIVIVIGMTAAWYTNVVQSGSLIFQVEEYGIDVEAVVLTTAVTAAPGDEGLVNLSASNAGAGMVKVSVNTSTVAMDASGQMQKRLYFFVDDVQTQNGEVLNRVYLNSTKCYDYLLFAGGALSLTDNYHNDVQLKWQWVYDVLGYYVLAEKNAEGELTVQEYLRPIEYDYDSATFEIVQPAEGETTEDGEPAQATKVLATVDGTTTPQDFLVAFSASDGYEGTIDPEKVTESGYYEVAIDEDGNGIYAYLCTPAEVATENAYDTALGRAAADGNPATYTVDVTIYSENISEEAVVVSGAEELIAALNADSDSVIRLADNVTLTETLRLDENVEAIVDLNGYTLTTAENEVACILEEGSSLTLTDGALTGSASKDAFQATGAELVLHDVDLEGYRYGVYVTDSSGTGADSIVRLLDCEFYTNDCAVLLYGNGTLSEQNTTVIIDGCALTSEDSCIFGNGTPNNPGKWGTDLQILNSTIVGKVAGVYHPQMTGTMTIYNSTVEGHTGVVIKGGTVTITDSTVKGTGTEVDEPGLYVSGFNLTGDAIYVETGYGYDIALTLNGEINLSCVAESAKQLRIYEEDAECVTYVNNSTNYADPAEETESADSE